jgi:hypothetical protein
MGFLNNKEHQKINKLIRGAQLKKVTNEACSNVRNYKMIMMSSLKFAKIVNEEKQDGNKNTLVGVNQGVTSSYFNVYKFHKLT